MLTVSTYRQVKSQENIQIQNNTDWARKRKEEKLGGIKGKEENLDGMKDKDSEREKDTQNKQWKTNSTDA